MHEDWRNAMVWHDAVKDPPGEGKYLVRCYNGVILVSEYLDKDNPKWIGWPECNQWWEKYATHWMPLPPPPKGGKHD